MFRNVKTTEIDGVRCYDANKKINRRKRHIVTDTLGLLGEMLVQGAEAQDQEERRRCALAGTSDHRPLTARLALSETRRRLAVPGAVDAGPSARVPDCRSRRRVD